MHASDVLLSLTFTCFGLVGLLTSVLFGSEALGGIIKPLAKFKPVEVVCGDGTCIRLEHTHWGRLFIIPNWWFGIVFYLLTIIAAITSNVWLVSFAVLGSFASVIISLILIYGLIFKLKAFCKLCYIAHAANFAIFITWLIVIAVATK